MKDGYHSSHPQSGQTFFSCCASSCRTLSQTRLQIWSSRFGRSTWLCSPCCACVCNCLNLHILTIQFSGWPSLSSAAPRELSRLSTLKAVFTIITCSLLLAHFTSLLCADSILVGDSLVFTLYLSSAISSLSNLTVSYRSESRNEGTLGKLQPPSADCS